MSLLLFRSTIKPSQKKQKYLMKHRSAASWITTYRELHKMSENIVIVILTWESVKKGNDDEHSSSGWQMIPARWWFNLKAYLICPVRLFLQISLWFDPILSPVRLFLLLPQVSLWFNLILSPLNLFLLLPQASCQWLCLSFTPGDKLFHKKSCLDTIIVLAWCKNDGSKIGL
jgi:hypothetical protein